MKQCSNCGQEWQDEAIVCGTCGTSLDETVATVPAELSTVPSEAPEKKKTGLLIVLIAAAVVIIGAVVAGFLTDWFGLIEDTDAGKSNDTDVSANANTDPVGDTQMSDPPTSLVAAFEAFSDIDTMTIIVTADVKTGDPALSSSSTLTWRTVTDDDGKVTMLAQNDMATKLYLDGVTYTLEEDYADKSESEEDVDWNELLSGELFAEGVDAESFVTALYQEYLTDEEWATAFLGYSRDGEVYTFEPDLYKLCKELMRIVEEKGAFTEENIDYLKTALDSWDESEAEDSSETLKLVFTAKDNILTKMQLVIVEEGVSYDILMEITDVGTTVITDSEIESVKKTVDEWVEKDICPECGQRLYGEELCWWCDEEADYDYCENCGAYGDVYVCGNYYVCAECLEIYDICDKCGAFAEVQYNDGYDLCEECNAEYDELIG